MDYAEEVLVCALALDKAFEAYEFIHVYAGPARHRRQAAKLTAEAACARLKLLAGRIDDSGVADEAPRWRRTYLLDFINCALAQYEVFVQKKRAPFAGTVERLIAAPPRPQFSLDRDFSALKKQMRALGFRSMPEFERSKKTLRFTTRAELNGHIAGTLEKLAGRLAKRCGGAFGFDLRRALAPANLRLSAPRAGEPDCFYRYDGAGRGTIGVAMRGEFTGNFIENFISHEAVPGHHFYYLVKQHRLDGGGTDAIDALDTFYSPENAVNEGLAVCADRLFGPLLDESEHFSNQAEKFLHKAMYNLWHTVNIQGRAPDAGILRLLRDEFGFSRERLAARLRYYTRDARFYTPAYPLGIAAIEAFPEGLPLSQIPLLYQQHSVKTLGRLALWLKKQKTAR